MKALWERLAAKVDALSLRERALVFAAATALAFAIVFFIAIDPAQRRQNTLLAQMKGQNEEIATLAKAGAARPSDPDVANRARIEGLRKEIRATEEALRDMQRDLVPAERMNAVLQDMVARDNQLALVSLRTLPTEPLVQADMPPRETKAGDPQKTEPPHVFKHGVEITVQGSYTGLHDYLARLERSPARMYWWRARLSTDEDARLTLTVIVFTLSLDRAWLQV